MITSVKGFVLKDDGFIVSTDAEDELQTIRLTNDSFYLLTLDFVNMTWTIEEIE